MRKYSFFLKINEYESIVYTNKNIHPHINHKKNHDCSRQNRRIRLKSINYSGIDCVKRVIINHEN
jgi:hypothetical protein